MEPTLLRLKTWRSLCSVLPNTLGLQWEENERVRPDQNVADFASSLRAHPSHSVRLRGARLWVGCYRNANNQCQSIPCWIVRAKRLQAVNGKVVIFRVTWTESVLLVPP